MRYVECVDKEDFFLNFYLIKINDVIENNFIKKFYIKKKIKKRFNNLNF